MSQIAKGFIKLVQKRSIENKNSIDILFKQGLIGNCISIIRQEIDTFTRIVYSGLELNLPEREKLMKSTLDAKK